MVSWWLVSKSRQGKKPKESLVKTFLLLPNACAHFIHSLYNQITVISVQYGGDKTAQEGCDSRAEVRWPEYRSSNGWWKCHFWPGHTSAHNKNQDNLRHLPSRDQEGVRVQVETEAREED